MQCNAMQCNAMQCNAMQCNAMQCNAMQCNTIQYNTIQYNTNVSVDQLLSRDFVLRFFAKTFLFWTCLCPK
jgi:hypothetical protein